MHEISNETLRTIAQRYSCRDFDPSPPSDAEIAALVDAALAAPSAVNKQPWRIIVIKDKSLIDDMDAAGMQEMAAAEDRYWYDLMVERGSRLFYGAPCMIMIASDGSDNAPLDCGIVSQNIALAAHAMGLGSCICGLARIPFSGGKGQEFKKRMKFPEGYVFGMTVLVGAAKSGKAPHDLDHAKVTYI